MVEVDVLGSGMPKVGTILQPWLLQQRSVCLAAHVLPQVLRRDCQLLHAWKHWWPLKADRLEVVSGKIIWWGCTGRWWSWAR